MKQATRALLFVVAALASLFLAACPPTPASDVVTIDYEQLGACNGFNNGFGVTTAGPQAAFVVLKVYTIRNKENGARDFNFDPEKLYVISSSPRAYVNNSSGVMAHLNPFLAQSRFVAKGTTQTINGSLIVVVQTGDSDGAREANNSSFTLGYDTPVGGQGVLMEKREPTRTTWPYTPDCTSIRF
jgi:hypothetical protein